MSNKFQIKRTSVTGRTPNTSDPSNTGYIDTGELALNLTDGKLFSSNGTISFEIGANLSTLSVSGNAQLATIIANGSSGSAGQVLISNGTTMYWGDQSGGGTGGGNTSSAIKNYSYNISSNTILITGSDVDGETLSYSSGQESVYVNGIKIFRGTDYITTNSTAITLTSNAVSGDVVEVVAFYGLENILISGDAILSNTSPNQLIDSFDKSTFRSAKYVIQASAVEGYHATEILLIHDDANTFLNEYSTIYTNVELITVSSNLNGSNVEITVTPSFSNTSLRTKKIAMEV